MSKVRITKVKSAIDRNERTKNTLQALGLNKMNDSKEVELNGPISGMINKVKHLLKVESI
jgi:large subunit ribosomal protein L30